MAYIHTVLILLNVRGLINVLGKPIVPVWLTFAASVFKCYSAKNNYFLAQHKHTQATESRERSYWYDWCWFCSVPLAYRTSMITPVHCSKTHASASHPTPPSPQVTSIPGITREAHGINGWSQWEVDGMNDTSINPLKAHPQNNLRISQLPKRHIAGHGERASEIRIGPHKRRIQGRWFGHKWDANQK